MTLFVFLKRGESVGAPWHAPGTDAAGAHPSNSMINVSGVYGHLDAPVSRVKIFIPRYRKNDPSYVITCPRYTGRVGCSLDMTNYPNDKHVCSFIMIAKGQTNVEFYAGRRALANKDLSVNLRHVLTRNETRPRVSGWQISNVTSRISYYDYGNITETKTSRYAITVAVQTVYFSRFEPSHMYTQNVPAVLFACFNIAGAVVQDAAHSMALFLLGLLLQGLFLRDFVDKIPLYYDSLPRIMQFLVVHLFLAAFGFLFITFREVWWRYQRKPHVSCKYPTSLDGWTRQYLLTKICSFTSSYIYISLLSMILLLM
ncbi:unnamed protein product [Heligmosomoides polygyrus]|uniref:Neur_chan_LBD domain-containing protein n=1 Tax=Heligmosomoides polygyrus TaxID=6339 RepID=A0A183GBC2_HELPZ|nr:unnamed protein product [Heligmosomoides polygyrus]